DPNTGACNHVPVTNGTSCSDGNACNGVETCQNGTCAAGTPPVCVDNNPCTADSCDPISGCVFAPVPDGTACSGTVCGSASTCRQGMCIPSTGPNCDDGNPCTADSCAADGTCVHTPVPDGTSCADQNACNGQEVCQAGACQPGTPVVCNASDQC